MPRVKKPKAKPIQSFVVEVGQEEVIVEVWENSADEGTRGAHMRWKHDHIFDIVLKYCHEALEGDSNFPKQKIRRLVDGSEPLSAFGKIIVTLAKQERVRVGKTLSEEIAKSVRIHFAAIEKALASKASQNSIGS